MYKQFGVVEKCLEDTGANALDLLANYQPVSMQFVKINHLTFVKCNISSGPFLVSRYGASDTSEHNDKVHKY